MKGTAKNISGRTEHAASRNGPAAWLDTLLESVPFGIVILGEKGNIIVLNHRAGELLARTDRTEALTGKNLLSITGNSSLLSEEVELFLAHPEKSHYMESVALHERILDCSLHPVEDGSVLIIHDVTREKELENSAIQSIITGQENERRRLAREVHDGIAPLLSSAKLELDLFMEELEQCGGGIPDTRLLNIRQTIDTISVDLRDLSHRLIPRLLEEFGLHAALKNLVTRTNQTSRSRVVFFSNLKPDERFTRDIELNLFRCGQELMNNAVKHACAGTIMLQAIRHEESIVMMVEDDGAGFDPAALQTDREGIGLMNVETRVKMLNGEFIMETVRDRGTLVSIEIPIQ